jgi:glycine cleavage system aminomethyltransferase T
LRRVKQAGVTRKLAGFEMVGRGIARGGYEIHSPEGERIGYVTTGMPSPPLGKNLGLGYVPSELAAEGSEFDVIVRDKPVRARVVKTPFLKKAIGMAYLPASEATVDREFEIDIRGRRAKARVVPMPFYKRPKT